MRHVYVLINNTGIGGAERRLGRVFTRLTQENPASTWIVNRSLWERLRAAGLVSGREVRVLRLPEPFGAVARLLRLSHLRVGFWLQKIDYILYASGMLCRYGLAAGRVFHAVLGGVYVLLPLLLLRRSHRALISVTNPSLEQMVGDSRGVLVYRVALTWCARIDALTERVREDLVRRGIHSDKISVPSGSIVDAAHFQPAAEKEPWVVFAGRLVEEKNPILFVESLPAIHRAVSEARFFLLGEGPLAGQITQRIERLHLQGFVEVGFTPDLSPLLCRARVFVSLQRQDNYPSQSLLEAMSCGTSTVATDVGLTWQLVDEDTGIRVKPDPEDIAKAVVTLLRDPQRCRRLGHAARARVLAQHSEERYAKYVKEQYARIAERVA